MWHVGAKGLPRNRFDDNAKIFHKETAKDFQGKQVPGHIYNSHQVLSISPKNKGKDKYSFSHSIREANLRKAKPKQVPPPGRYDIPHMD